MVAEVYLLRHGQTAWSVSGQHTGITEVPLTPAGEEEARLLGVSLRQTKFHRVFSSPRVRALKTCELAGLGTRVEVQDDLREWGYGDYEGLLTSEIHAKNPGWKIFEHGCPTGESVAQVGARADRLLEMVRKLEGKIALFSHGHFSRVLAARWVNQPVSNAQILASSTASMNILGFSTDGTRPVIRLWNYVAKK